MEPQQRVWPDLGRTGEGLEIQSIFLVISPGPDMMPCQRWKRTETVTNN